MAGTTESKAATTRRQVASPVPYLEYDEFVEVQIAKTRDSLRSNEVITALTRLAFLWVGYLLMVVILDQWVADRGLSPQIRMILLLGLIALSGVITLRHILWPLFRRIHPLYAARVIEESEARFQGNLVNWIDLKSAGRASETSAAVRAIEKRAAVGLDRMDVDAAVDRRPLMRAAYALLGVVVLSAMYVAFSPKDPFSSVHRALLPLSSTGVSTETTISDITPGDLEVTARSQVTVEADLRGKPVEKAHILLTTADRRFVDQPVEMRRIESGLPRFRGVLNGENGRGLLQDVDYRIVANDAQSETFHIRVIQPPSAQIEKLTYTYPAYMQLEPREVPGPAVEAWEGTKVTFAGRTNLPVSQARLILTDTEQGTQGEEVSLRIEGGTQLSGSWTLAFRSDGTAPRFYHVAVKTADGSIDPNPVRIPIEVRADQRPEVALLFPTSDLEKPANAIIPLAISASDPDFQLRSLTLKSERNGTPLPDLPLFESEFPTRTIERTWEWDLGRLGLQAGERVQYWIEARDNRLPVANRTNTPRLSVLVQEPLGTEQQVQRDLADARQQLNDDLTATRPNSNPEGADSPQEPEQPRQNSVDPNTPPEQPLARSAEQSDGDETESDSNPDRNDPNDTDEQAEFQNQLERLLNREERLHDSAAQKPQEEPTKSSETDVDDETLSRQEPQDNGTAADSEDGQPDTQRKRSQTKTGGQNKTPSPGDSRADTPQENSEDDREEDSAESTGRKAERGQADPAKPAPKRPNDAQTNDTQSNAGKSKTGQPDPDQSNTGKAPGASNSKDSTRGSKQTRSQSDGSEQTERPEEGAPSEKPSARSDRPQTGKEPERDEGRDADSSADSMEKRTPRKTNDSNAGDEGAVSEQDEEGKPAGNDSESGSDASAPNDSTKKPSKQKGPKPKSSSAQGDGSPSRNEQNDGESHPQLSAEDGDEPSPAETPSKTSEPPSGERPSRPGQQSQSPSKPEKSNPAGSDDSDTSENPDSQGQGDSQQSDQSPGKPGKSQGSRGQKQSGSQGDMKSNPGNTDPADAQPSGPDKPQGTQSKPPGASKTGPQQGAGKQSSPTSDPGRDRPTGKESGDSGQETDEATQTVSDDSARNPRGESSDPARGARKPKRESKSRSGNSQGESTPSEVDSDPQGKQPGESREHEDPPSEREGTPNSTKNSSKRPNNPSEVGNQRPKGQGRPQGQQSQQPEAGEQGRSSASDQGESGGHQEGAGESTNEAGDSQPTGQKTGQSGKSPGTGRKEAGNSQSGQGDSRSEANSPSKSGKQEGQREGTGETGSDSEDQSQEEADGGSGDSPNESDSAAGKQGSASGKPRGQSGGTPGQSSKRTGEQGPSSKPGSSNTAPAGGKAGGGANAKSGQAGDPSGQPSGASGQSGAGRLGDGAQGDKPARDGAGSPQGRGIPEGGGQGEGSEGDGGAGSGNPPATAEPQLDELKEASNLILQRLKGQLSRGEVDEETLQELGWKDLGQLKKFVSRLEEGLADSPDDMSPDAQARRRQFEEILKSLKLDSQTATREQGTGTERRVDQVDAGRRPVPSSLRERYEAYTRSLSKQGSSGKGASKSPAPPPRGGPSR